MKALTRVTERASCRIAMLSVVRDSGARVLQLFEQHVRVATALLMIMFSISKSCFII